MTNFDHIIAQLDEATGYEAPYTDDGRYTAFVTLHDDGFNTTYRVAYMRGIEFTHDEYFDRDQLANEMTNLNADPAAWVRWECVDGDWNPVEAAPTINDIVTRLDDAASIEWVNLTPHMVDIHTAVGVIEVPASGQLARVEQTRETLPDVGGVPVTRSTFGAVQGLPKPSIGKRFIVSALVLAQCAGREDVFAPGEAVRDEAGRVIGCLGLSAAPAAPAVDWERVAKALYWSTDDHYGADYVAMKQFGLNPQDMR